MQIGESQSREQWKGWEANYFMLLHFLLLFLLGFSCKWVNFDYSCFLLLGFFVLSFLFFLPSEVLVELGLDICTISGSECKQSRIIWSQTHRIYNLLCSVILGCCIKIQSFFFIRSYGILPAKMPDLSHLFIPLFRLVSLPPPDV